MTERIEQIGAEGLAAIEAATSTQELEEARIRYLGRKAELPNLLRGVAELPPDQRAQTGKAANAPARRSSTRSSAARASSRPPSSSSG